MLRPVLSWALVLVSATVGVHVEIASELPAADREAVLGMIGTALEGAGHRAVRENGAPKLCPADSPCVSNLRKRLKAEEILLARIIGGASRVRLTLTRAEENKPVRADLDQERRDQWQAAIGEAVTSLFPPLIAPIEPAPPPEVAKTEPPQPPPTTQVIAASPPPERAQPIAAYACWGAAAALVATSAILFASANASLSDHEEGFIRDDGKIVNVTFQASEKEYDSIDLRRHVSLGALLLGLGIGGAGTLLYLSGEDGEPVAIVPAASGVSVRF